MALTTGASVQRHGLHRLQALQNHLAATARDRAAASEHPLSSGAPGRHRLAGAKDSDTDALMVRCSPGTASAWLARST